MAKDLFGGELPLTSLVGQPTSVDQPEKQGRKRAVHVPGQKEFDRWASRAAYDLPPATDAEINFRHSGWRIERERVTRALQAAHVKDSRLDRFMNCGGDCVVEYSPSTRRHRLRANYCGDRFCVPCNRARAVKFRRKVEQLIGSRVPLFITLTLRGRGEPLSKMIDHLLASFRRLRQTMLWKSHVQAGVAVIEVKKGAGGFGWHPHLHVLALGDYLPQTLLSEQWRECSRGSFVVDVQRARHSADAAGYVTKYVSKGWTSEVARDHDALIECVTALRGRRLLVLFGQWYGLDFDDDNRDPADWKPIASLTRIVAAAAAGETWAVGVMRSLNASPDEKSNPPPDAD